MSESVFVSSLAQSLVRTDSKTAEAVFRSRAWQEHQKLGWPDSRNESWRYTNSNKIVQSRFSWMLPATQLSASESADVSKWAESFDVVVIKDGKLLTAIQSQMAIQIHAIEERWEKLSSIPFQWSDGFSPAMVSSAWGGAWIEISETPSRPILIAHFQGAEGSSVSNLNVLRLASGVHATVLELWSSTAQTFAATVSYFDVQDNARLTYGRVVRANSTAQHFSDVQIHLHRDARLQLTNLHLGSEWSRSVVTTTLSGTGSEAHMNGIAFGMGHEHNDQRVEARHLAPHSISRQLFKGVWRDRSRGIVNGKIYIAPGAQKVDSAQLNHNLLLSWLAEADTKPELEVYADDVKANHGASVGRMDEDKLFYLQSRGIPFAKAVQLLAEGFIQDIISKCESPQIRALMDVELQKILPNYARELEGAPQ